MNFDYYLLICYIFIFLSGASSITLLIFSKVKHFDIFDKKISFFCLMIFIEGALSLIYYFSGIVVHKYYIGVISSSLELGCDLLLIISCVIYAKTFSEKQSSAIFVKILILFYIVFYAVNCLLSPNTTQNVQLYVYLISELLFIISLILCLYMFSKPLFQKNKYAFINFISIILLLLYWTASACNYELYMRHLSGILPLLNSPILELVLWLSVNISTTVLLFNLWPNKTLHNDKNLVDIKECNLTKRETEILLLLGEGKSNREIQDLLFISEGTTKVHISHIYKKLNVKNRIEASNFARKINR